MGEDHINPPRGRVDFRANIHANGIKISLPDVSTSRRGVPEMSSPGNCTSRMVPRRVGASGSEHGEEDITGGTAEVSNTEQPIRSDTKYWPAGSVTRCSNGSSTSSPRNFSASEIESTPQNEKPPARDDSGSASRISVKCGAAHFGLRPVRQKLPAIVSGVPENQ